MSPTILSSGVRVIADPVPGARTFALAVAIDGGARHEPEGRGGWSHLLEHMVFKGAGDMDAREIVERIERDGGSINASTGHERTVFEVRGMDGALPTAVQVLADLVQRPWLDAQELEREKEVIAQEIAEAFDTPDDHVFDMAQGRAFADQGLGRPILGSVEQLAAADRDALEAWRAGLYAPGGVVVAASGAVAPQALIEAVESRFAAGPPAEREPASRAAFTGGHARQARRIEQANLVFLLPGCGAADAHLPAFRLLAEILGGGMASRLFQEAREKRGLAYAVDAWQDSYAETGLLGVFAGCAPERAEELARVCAGELADLASAGPTSAEMSRAKAVLKAGLWMSEESLASRAGRLATQTLVYGAPRRTEDLAAALDACTVEDVRAAAARVLDSRAAASAVLGPRPAHRAGEALTRALWG